MRHAVPIAGPVLKACIYARYSSDQQREASLEDQIRLCREKISRERWTLVEIFSDAAISGAVDRRPGYQALLRSVKETGCDVIVSEALDRLSRDQEDLAALHKRCRFAGVQIVTLAEGICEELQVAVKGTMNAMFLQRLGDSTRRGLRGRVIAGYSGGGKSYGYVVKASIGKDGHPEAGLRKIDDAQAAVVRRIATDYADGISPKSIANALNEQGIPSPRGGYWSASSINGNRRRGTGVLNNELYTGQLVWNRLSYVKHPETDKRVSRANAADAVVRVAAPALQIIDDALWQRVRARQGLLDQKAAASGGAPHAKQRPRHLFSGLMRCGCCGAGFSKVSANHFGCSGARNKGAVACTNLATIRCDILETTVLEGLRTRLMDPAIYKAFADAFVAEWNLQVALDASKSDGHRSELARVCGQIERLVDAIADGGMTMASVRDRLATLEARKSELTASLAAPVASPPRLHPNLAEVYRQEVASLTEALGGEDASGARETVRGLIDSITIYAKEPGVEGNRRMELRGALAAIIALGRGGDAVPDALAEQMEMVAGTGFEPVTFRL